MRVLVTGGAGYIGSITVEKLIEAGQQVLVFDNLSQGHRNAVHPDAAFVCGDLAEREAIDRAMDDFKPEAIMHFAANTLVGESMAKPFTYLADNTICGLNLLQSAVEFGVERFILSSTANLFETPDVIPISEDEQIIPGSPYGESKYILERILYWLDRTKGVRYAALRYFNAAGATEARGEDHDPETHLIPLILQVAQGKREKIVIFGDDYATEDGTCVRDYIHVADLAQAHILALHALDKGSRVYNMGNGRGYSVRQVIETASRVTGCAIATEVGPRRPGDPSILIASSAKIRHELNWQPQHGSIEEIVESAWRWHQAHPNGYGA